MAGGIRTPNLPIPNEEGQIPLHTNAFYPVLVEHGVEIRCCCSVPVNAGHSSTVRAQGCATRSGLIRSPLRSFSSRARRFRCKAHAAPVRAEPKTVQNLRSLRS